MHPLRSFVANAIREGHRAKYTERALSLRYHCSLGVDALQCSHRLSMHVGWMGTMPSHLHTV